MADNVTITQGTGTTIGADEISSVKYQRVKVIVGADGTNDGDVCTGNPMPVSDAGGSITVDGTVAVTNAGITTIAGAVAGTEMQVDVLTMPTVTVNAHAVTNAGTFAVQVDSSSLPTGAATAAKQLPDGHSVALSATDNAVLDAIAASAASVDGKVTACNTGAVVLAAGSAAIGKLAANSGVDIGDVDVASCALPTGAATSALQTSSEAILTTIDADTGAIKTAVEVIDNAISGSEMQVDVVAALPAGTNIIGAVKRDVINYTPVRKYYTYSGAVTDGIIWSPAGGKKWVITDIIMSVSAAATVTLEDDKSAGDAVVLALDLAANGGVSTNLQTPIVSEEADADLIITTSAGNVKITVVGYEI